ncbi:hypothetical protein CDL15_Pgr027839 [Punica granatum]|uniref:BZIP domain-containing protein n=1 Tax=Punica granatum TaxID=22663 RepID=A0A218XL63_PUNGR|nr:hypothetical protein CDL15_Pgr027839 [Punica granatum]
MDQPPQFTAKPPLVAVDMIIDQMADTPQQRRPHHRRAHSDTTFRHLDDDLLLFDPSDFDLSSLDLLPPATPTPPRVPTSPAPHDSSDDGSSSNPRPRPSQPVGHFRSLSVDSDFFEGLGLTLTGGGDEKFGGGKQPPTPQGEKRSYHRHSNSMDGSLSSATALFDVESDGAKKAMAADKLAELALIDPKRAKRYKLYSFPIDSLEAYVALMVLILANRQSAARSKERKIRYTGELERKVQTLQSEATTLSAQVTILQRDTTGLTAENKELKLRLQAMEQQAQLRDALNEKLREEVQRLKIAAAQLPAVNGNPFARVPPQFPATPGQPLHNLAGNPNMPTQQHSPSGAQQGLDGQPRPSFLDFNNRA